MSDKPKYYGREYEETVKDDAHYWTLKQYATKLGDVCAADMDSEIDLLQIDYDEPIPTVPGCSGAIPRVKAVPLTFEFPTNTPRHELAKLLGIGAERTDVANALGRGEKWLARSTEQPIAEAPWFFVTPVGLLYAGALAEHVENDHTCYAAKAVKLLAAVGVAVYQKPKLVFFSPVVCR